MRLTSNLGWKGPQEYVATVPQVFDLWQDPQERYDIFMNNYTERHLGPGDDKRGGEGADADVCEISAAQTAERGYSGPITLTQYEHFQFLRDQLAKEGFQLPLPTGN